jgi:hypothetical protein
MTLTRPRIVKLTVAAAAVALIAWIAMHTYWDEVSVPTPLQGEAARNPFYSVEHLAGALGVRTRRIASLRFLPRNSVVLINDLHDDLLHERIESIQSWVESGGRLIVTGDTLWSSGSLQTWSGIAPSHQDPDKSFVPRGRFVASFNPDENCTPMTVRVKGAVTGQSWLVCGPTSETAFASKRVLPAWSLSDAQGMQILRADIGSGEFIVFGPRWILNNKSLPIHDNAQVLIDAARLQRGDALLILSPSRAEPLLALLWRLAAPAIVFLAAAALLLVLRGLPRFGPPLPVPVPIRRSLAEQIRANARFAWRTRKLGPLRAAVRRSLDEAARRQVAGFGALNERQRASALAARTGVDPGALSAALTLDAAGDAQVQRRAIALLETCRRILEKLTPTRTKDRA